MERVGQQEGSGSAGKTSASYGEKYFETKTVVLAYYKLPRQ